VSTPSKTPTYNLKVVLRETGIKPDTLRAWERRYGLPMPERSSGGHRLYSQYDIETIKWLMDRQVEGLRINRAVKLWRSIEESGEDPLVAMPPAESEAQPITVEVIAGDTLEEIRENWIAACLAFDEPTADNILAQAFARFPLETVCLEVLRKGMSQIGELWYQGESTVQQEHFASALAIRRLEALIAAAPAPSKHERILIACPPGEDHVFSPLMVTLLLRQRGWNVIYLGANVPLSRLKATIATTQPNLIILTAMQLHTAANLYDMAQYVRGEGVPLAYGGFAFVHIPGLGKHIPGHYLGDQLESVVPVVERFMAAPGELSEPEPVPEHYQKTLSHYRDKQPMIDAYLWDTVKRNGLKDYHLTLANKYLARDIDAALRLGDINYVQPDLDWLAALLVNFNVAVELLPKYMTYYKEALNTHLDERGQPIIEWMDNFIEG
jgi:methanogenic corrinoid protein MtbC1